jgi:trans-aconitate methyltransferase
MTGRSRTDAMMTMHADWNADLYLRFEDERTRPSIDLIQRVRFDAPSRCIDLGCGPGNSTELVAARFPAARTEGLDSSPDMINKARKRLPGLEFVLADLETWSPAQPYDVIFANAVLQWIPDHAGLFTRLARSLAPGGVLAVQMPTMSQSRRMYPWPRSPPTAHGRSCSPTLAAPRRPSVLSRIIAVAITERVDGV